MPAAAAINSLDGSAANAASVIFIFLLKVSYNIHLMKIIQHIYVLLLLQLQVLQSSHGTYSQPSLPHRLCKGQ